MTDLEPVQPSLCQRICCCMTNSAKEPPVQLIRSGALDVKTVTNGHISAAEKSIDGFEDVNLEQRSVINTTSTTTAAPAAAADTSKLRVLAEKDRNAVNMNDIMMDEILGDESRHDEVDGVFEDAISISTNVIEEVDESELSQLRLHPSCEVLFPDKPTNNKKPSSGDGSDGRVSHDAHDDRDDHDRDDRDKDDDNSEAAVETQAVSLSFDMPSTSKEKDEKEESKTEDDESAIEETTRDEEFSESEKEMSESERSTPKLEKSSRITQIHGQSAGPSVIQIVPKEDDESDIDDEIILAGGVTPTVQKPFDPPPLPSTKSIMYADTSSSEEDSDDEVSREVLPPVQRSQRFTNIDQLRSDHMVNGHANSESTQNGMGRQPSSDSSSSFDDELLQEVKKKTSKEENGGASVTRIVVRDHGLPDVLGSGGVKVHVETITDEEFSEKLI
ncbi:unnamed protein product [Haemonchus placei]|uniref:Glutaredoxin domain-containing protein n=1 Tax=Haemonchus placei TaxID=6290 RepID=A0A0N4WAH3_HAEPC|nr:unnamed protein product [Haemonchus placei]